MKTIVFEGVLFKIKLGKNKSVPSHLLLCIPDTFISTILYQYHDFLLAGHQGVLRTYLTLKQKYWFSNMFLCIRKYILSCSTCQSRKEKDSTIGALYPRTALSFRSMSEISADVKHMPSSRLGRVATHHEKPEIGLLAFFQSWNSGSNHGTF